MSEVELLEIIRSTNAQITALYGQVISINFAMVLAIYYFLNRAPLVMKLLSFAMYLVGMLMYVGLMLEESNIKVMALRTLADLGDSASPFTQGVLALQASWLFAATSVFLNLGLWMLVGVTGFLLFVWRKPEARGPLMTS